MSGSGPIRVTIQQPALARYRVPVFAALAARPGLAVKVVYGTVPGLANARPTGFAAEHVPQRVVRLPGRRLLWHAPQWSCAARRSSDVLILGWNLNYLSLVPALLRARRQGVATILWGHGYSRREAAWRSGPRRRVSGLATAVMFYGHVHAGRFIERGGDARRVFVALNSLDQAPIARARSAWLADPAALAAFRREHDLEDRPIVLFVSRLLSDNRVDLLIEAVALLAGDFPALLCLLIGSGEAEPALRRLAAERGVADRVRFLGPIYEEEALARYFLSSAVFAYPSNVGLSLLHAFGYGLPVLTTNRAEAQNPEIEALVDGENGLLYADGDPVALAAALRTILLDEALRDHLGSGALKTVRERFTLDRMVDGMEAAIRFSFGAAGHSRQGGASGQVPASP